ncbi:unnamed protein product [Gulo gulo]|uniref:Uncharacterized protein n=1 Tax=Gulo gulo TaxID=48420 RepID=A0A9X9LZS3_GULGU|nr:unnamed protein product [Gulo gulo]
MSSIHLVTFPYFLKTISEYFLVRRSEFGFTFTFSMPFRIFQTGAYPPSASTLACYGSPSSPPNPNHLKCLVNSVIPFLKCVNQNCTFFAK